MSCNLPGAWTKKQSADYRNSSLSDQLFSPTTQCPWGREWDDRIHHSRTTIATVKTYPFSFQLVRCCSLRTSHGTSKAIRPLESLQGTSGVI